MAGFVGFDPIVLLPMRGLADKGPIRGICFHGLMPIRHRRSRTMQRTVETQLDVIVRRLGGDLSRARSDAGATMTAVAERAGIHRAQIGRIERAKMRPSLETLVACAAALGAEVSIRIYTGRGPRLTDRHQARMVEEVLRQLAPIWRPHLEVPVSRPSRGVIDAVFERSDQPLLVISEFQSTLPRLEQQLRWIAEKAHAIGSSDLIGPRPIPPTSNLLVLRSSASTRALAREFESTLRAAYPANMRSAVGSLRHGTAWSGSAIVWVRIDGDGVDLLDGPPRGVSLGR
jgi:transcriptional regulator with XRE-family HTH domain